MSKVNTVGVGYSESVCDNTRRDRVKSEWELNDCRLNIKVNNQYEQSAFQKMNED